MSRESTHFNYEKFEEDMRYHMLLFDRSIKRINNELEIE
jgi:hypothetical protein